MREEVRPNLVAARIKRMVEVEDAYLRLRGAEHGEDEVAADPDDDELEHEGQPMSRRGERRAARAGNDDGAQGEGETKLPSQRRPGAANGSCLRLPSDPERHLLVEHEPEELQAVLAAGATEGAPVSVRQTILVYPPDATGFVRVVREPEACALPKDFPIADEEEFL